MGGNSPTTHGANASRASDAHTDRGVHVLHKMSLSTPLRAPHLRRVPPPPPPRRPLPPRCPPSSCSPRSPAARPATAPVPPDCASSTRSAPLSASAFPCTSYTLPPMLRLRRRRLHPRHPRTAGTASQRRRPRAAVVAAARRTAWPQPPRRSLPRPKLPQAA